jgi:hypothetical protein
MQHRTRLTSISSSLPHAVMVWMTTLGVEPSGCRKQRTLSLSSMMHHLASALQFIGAVVTALGLWNAHSRANTGFDLCTRFKHWRARRKRVAQNVQTTGIASEEAVGTPTLTMSEPSRPFDDLTPDEKFAALAKQVETLEIDVRTCKNDVTQLGNEVEQAKIGAAQHAHRAFIGAVERMDGLRSEDQKKQMLDLRWAILGLAISALGVFLSFFA